MTKPCDISNQDIRLDAVVQMEDKTVYGFRGDTYFSISESSGVSEPRPIFEWEGLSGHVDAAVTFKAIYKRNIQERKRELVEPERLFIFQDNRVFLYYSEDKSLAKGFPRQISDVFPGLPNHIDSAFRWNGNGKVYFTKGNRLSQSLYIKKNSVVKFLVFGQDIRITP